MNNIKNYNMDLYNSMLFILEAQGLNVTVSRAGGRQIH